MAHALAPHLGQRHLHTAFLTDEALVLHALVLAAQALVVLDGTKDACTEKTVTLGLEGAIVDRLWLLDLTERPRADVVRARDRDTDLVEGRDLHLLFEEVGDLVHRLSLLEGCGATTSLQLHGSSPTLRGVAAPSHKRPGRGQREALLGG